VTAVLIFSRLDDDATGHLLTSSRLVMVILYMEFRLMQKASMHPYHESSYNEWKVDGEAQQ